MPYNPDCPACKDHRWHTDEEWKHHPDAGTGRDRDQPPAPVKTEEPANA